MSAEGPLGVRGWGLAGGPRCQGSREGPGLEIQQPVGWAHASMYPANCRCKKARATLRRLEAELYSSWLGKRCSRWSCTRPHPSHLPEPKKTGGATNGSLCSPLSFAQVEAGERRAGVAAVMERPGLQGWGGLLGWGQVDAGALLVLGAATGTGTELRARGHGRGCLGCAHHPT